MSGGHRETEVFLRRLWAMESALVASGMPAMPQWWRETIERFYRSGKRRLVVRKGRRVFASTCIAPRLAVSEMLFGEHRHLPGTPPLVFAFLSVKRDEAAKRLIGVRAILDVLQEPYGERGETIELRNRPATFSVVTANHRTNVGDTVAFAWCDEVTGWNDDELGANPAEQVVGRLSPAQATLPDAKMYLVSSPLTKDDYHARQFDLGETPAQCVAFGATWEINPTLTEAETRVLEPDVRTWRREYAAEPSEGAVENWFGSAVDAAIDHELSSEIPPGVRPVIGLDPAFDLCTPDLFGWCIVTSEQEDESGKPRRMTRVRRVGAWRPDRSPSELALRVRWELCDVYETDHAYTDQFEGYSFAEIARGAELRLEVIPWTGGNSEHSKLARFKAVRLAMLEGAFRIPADPDLIRELRSIRGILTSGGERIELPRTAAGHCDRVSAMVLAGSVALSRAPCEATRPLKPVDEMAEHRRKMIREIERKRRNDLAAASRGSRAAIARLMGWRDYR